MSPWVRVWVPRFRSERELIAYILSIVTPKEVLKILEPEKK